MKKLEKKKLFQVMGGAFGAVWATMTTTCTWSNGIQSCVGEYTFSGETLFLACTDPRPSVSSNSLKPVSFSS